MSTAHRPAHSFRLRFGWSRELGRSHVSPVRPLAMPLPVTDKFYSSAPSAATQGDSEEALHFVTQKYECGPRDQYTLPATSAHEYGWWVGGARAAEDPRLDQRIRDSPWLKERMRVLAADDKLKHN